MARVSHKVVIKTQEEANAFAQDFNFPSYLEVRPFDRRSGILKAPWMLWPVIAFTECGGGFPIHPLLLEAFKRWNLFPSQCQSSLYRIVLGVAKLNAVKKFHLGLDEIEACYLLHPSDRSHARYHLQVRGQKMLLIYGMPSFTTGEEANYIWIRGHEAIEALPGLPVTFAPSREIREYADMAHIREVTAWNGEPEIYPYGRFSPLLHNYLPRQVMHNFPDDTDEQQASHFFSQVLNWSSPLVTRFLTCFQAMDPTPVVSTARPTKAVVSGSASRSVHADKSGKGFLAHEITKPGSSSKHGKSHVRIVEMSKDLSPPSLDPGCVAWKRLRKVDDKKTSPVRRESKRLKLAAMPSSPASPIVITAEETHQVRDPEDVVVHHSAHKGKALMDDVDQDIFMVKPMHLGKPLAATCSGLHDSNTAIALLLAASPPKDITELSEMDRNALWTQTVHHGYLMNQFALRLGEKLTDGTRKESKVLDQAKNKIHTLEAQIADSDGRIQIMKNEKLALDGDLSRAIKRLKSLEKLELVHQQTLNEQDAMIKKFKEETAANRINYDENVKKLQNDLNYLLNETFAGGFGLGLTRAGVENSSSLWFENIPWPRPTGEIPDLLTMDFGVDAYVPDYEESDMAETYLMSSPQKATDVQDIASLNLSVPEVLHVPVTRDLVPFVGFGLQREEKLGGDLFEIS